MPDAPMDLDTRVKLAVYRHFAETGRAPAPAEVATRAGAGEAQVLDAYPRLRAQRLLVLEADGVSIRMASPFSGVPTQHVVESGFAGLGLEGEFWDPKSDRFGR